jgi:hypothetical protein
LAKDADLGGVTAPRAAAELAKAMEADEPSLAEYALRMLDVPRFELLNKNWLGERVISLEFMDRRVQVVSIVYDPDRAARGADCALEDIWKNLDVL